jgi:ankyrin repeat protein
VIHGVLNHTRNYIRYSIYLIVLIWFSICRAGSYDDFFSALIQDNPGAITALLQRGFDPNTVDPSGLPGLLVAMKASSFGAAAALVAWPTTRVEVRNSADESPLMLASLQGALTLVKALIARGADVNKPGWAPLHYAATNGHLEVMQLLLDESAYIDAASPNGSTPLMMAAQYGSDTAVKLLLEAGADALLTNELGLTAMAFAERVNRSDTVQIIDQFIRARQPQGAAN